MSEFELVRVNLSRTRRSDAKVEKEMLVIQPDGTERLISLRNDEKPVRQCHECGREIPYKEYIESNTKRKYDLGIEFYRERKFIGYSQDDPSLDLKQIWDCKYIRLYCCACYNNLLRSQDLNRTF